MLHEQALLGVRACACIIFIDTALTHLVQGDQLAGMWSGALPLGLEGKMAALQAALEFIGTSPPPVASARTGEPTHHL